jgi:hypothetical protein
LAHALLLEVDPRLEQLRENVLELRVEHVQLDDDCVLRRVEPHRLHARELAVKRDEAAGAIGVVLFKLPVGVSDPRLPGLDLRLVLGNRARVPCEGAVGGRIDGRVAATQHTEKTARIRAVYRARDT